MAKDGRAGWPLWAPSPRYNGWPWSRSASSARPTGRRGSVCSGPHFLTHAADVCYLQDLFTAPEARGRGVARALIAAVVEWARERECSRVYRQTKESNARAPRLYDQVAANSGFIVYQI